jgi:starch-binding outer membrane protein, SusD/RagB family
MKRLTKIYLIALLLLTSTSILSCRKQLAIDEDTILLENEAVSNPQQLQELLNSCYDVAANVFNGNYQLFSDLLSDDLAKPFNDGGTFRTEIWNRSTTIFNSDVISLYANLYSINYRCNLIEGALNNVPGLTDADKQRSLGEIRFLRALSHFKTLQLWAQPAGYTSDNSHLGIVIRNKLSTLPVARSTVEEGYAQVLSDLDAAIANLPSSNGRYADLDAAKSLKALVLFQMNNLNESIVLLDEVINSGRFTLSDSLDRYYGNNYSPASKDPEFIFGFSSPSTDNRGGYFTGAYRVSGSTQPSASFTNEIYAAIAVDSTDMRNKLIKQYNVGQANQFIGTTKFDDVYFGTPFITLTQLYLTRAEVLARLGTNLPQAVSDVNQIIARAYPTNPTKLLGNGESADNILATVELERRKEFFGEGDRVHYMRRKGAFYARSSTVIRGVNWDCDGLTLQFPSNEKSAVFIFNPTGNCN